MSLANDIDSYFGLQAKIHEALGYVEDWRVIPMDDCRGKHWMLVGGEGVGASCVLSDEPFTMESLRNGKKVYSNSVYTQRFLKKWVYRSPTHVMVACDTHTDGNKLLRIFDADKECTDEALQAEWKSLWGRLWSDV